MRNPHNTFIEALSLIKPENIIPCLEQSIEVEKLNQIVNPTIEGEEKIRELGFLLVVLRAWHLGELNS